MAPGNGMQLAEYLRQMRGAVLHAAGVLDGDVYEAVKELFLACHAPSAAESAPLLDELRRLAPQYGKPEVLLPVDGSGTPLAPGERILQDFRLSAAVNPELALWFQETGGTLLVARWLCTLSGLRHRTVELFIDHPQAPGYTLVQVRSLAKLEYPGYFDLPCAGHVVGLASVEEGLFRELAEELSLREADLAGPQWLGTYNHAESRGAHQNATDHDAPHSDAPHSYAPDAMLDVEFRTVFRARLQPGALERIRFADGEVAAIAVFAIDELRSLVRDHPTRIASGLSASLALYLTSSTQAP